MAPLQPDEIMKKSWVPQATNCVTGLSTPIHPLLVMKRILKLYLKIFLVVLAVSILNFILTACDSLGEDAVPLQDPVLTDASAVVLSSASATINLAPLVSSTAPVTIAISQQPTRGQLFPLAMGEYLYVPKADFIDGNDVFVFEANGQGVNAVQGQFTMNVIHEEADLPCRLIAMADVGVTTKGALTTLPILRNDINCQDAFTIDDVQLIEPDTLKGALTLSNDFRVGYTAAEAVENYTDVFMYRICDTGQGECAFTTVAVHVADDDCLPVTYDDEVVVDGNKDRYFINVLANDDVCGKVNANQTLALLLNNEPAGQVSLNRNRRNQPLIEYVPQVGFQGVDSIYYQLCSRQISNLCDTALLRVIVQ